MTPCWDSKNAPINARGAAAKLDSKNVPINAGGPAAYLGSGGYQRSQCTFTFLFFQIFGTQIIAGWRAFGVVLRIVGFHN